MLQSFYTCDYNAYAHTEKSSFEFSAEMYSMADKYDVKALKEIVKHKFSQDMVELEVHQVDDLVHAINIIYTTTLSSDRGLRDVLAPALRRHKDLLLENEGYMELIASSLGEGGFTTDVVDALTQLSLSGHLCARCSNMSINPRNNPCEACGHDIC